MLTDYILRARPKVDSPYLFLSFTPPVEPFKCASPVSRIVQKRLRHSEIESVGGAHLLRHSLIPGVGVQTSAAFAAAINEAGRFWQSRTAGAYFGLVPRRHQSGEIDWTGRIIKQGDTMGAQAALRSGQLDPDAQSRQFRPEEMGHEDCKTSRLEKVAWRSPVALQ